VHEPLLTYWSRTDLDFATRVAALRAGSVSGVPQAFNSNNIHDDVAADKLTGNGALDWYFAKLAAPNVDTITDLDAAGGEQVN
jgi:hypothetical protein